MMRPSTPAGQRDPSSPSATASGLQGLPGGSRASSRDSSEGATGCVSLRQEPPCPRGEAPLQEAPGGREPQPPHPAPQEGNGTEGEVRARKAPAYGAAGTPRGRDTCLADLAYPQDGPALLPQEAEKTGQRAAGHGLVLGSGSVSFYWFSEGDVGRKTLSSLLPEDRPATASRLGSPLPATAWVAGMESPRVPDPGRPGCCWPARSSWARSRMHDGQLSGRDLFFPSAFLGCFFISGGLKCPAASPRTGLSASLSAGGASSHTGNAGFESWECV